MCIISAIFALEDIIVRLQEQKICVMLVIKNEEIRKQLKDINIVAQVGESNIFYNEYDAVDSAKKLIKDTLLEQEND